MFFKIKQDTNKLLQDFVDVAESAKVAEFMQPFVESGGFPYSEDLRTFCREHLEGMDSTIGMILADGLEKAEANALIEHLRILYERTYDDLHGTNLGYRCCIEPMEPPKAEHPYIRRMMAKAVSLI